MSGDGTIVYNLIGLADQNSAMQAASHQLDQIGQEAHSLLAGSQQFYTGDYGAPQYHQAQQLINEGIQDGKDVIYRHGNAVDTAGSTMHGADKSAGSSFSA